MNLIDKYIAEVGKYLPRKNRADIEAEIRSTLEDMLEERQAGSGPASEAAVLALLKEYGSPRQVAATYKTQPYLIGPRLFPVFEMVVRIVLIVVTAASLIGLAVSLTRTGLSGPEFLSALGQWAAGLFSGLIGAFGNVALVFAILERTQVAEKFEKELNDWDPQELKSEPGPDQVDFPDHIAAVIFTVLGLVVLNLYPGVLALRYSSGGSWVTAPILTDAFFRYLPWINVMGLLQLVFHGYMLSQRDWTPLTRVASILVDVAGMALAVSILRTPGIFAITAELPRLIGDPQAAASLARLFQLVPTILIVLVVIGTLAHVGQTLWRLFSSSSSSPYPVAK